MRRKQGPWTRRVIGVVVLTVIASTWAIVRAANAHRVDDRRELRSVDRNVHFLARHLEAQMQKTGTLPDLSGLEDRVVDEYGTDIRIAVEFATVTITSAGEDRKFDTADDCVQRVERWTGSRPTHR